jgi:hypothetical protein
MLFTIFPDCPTEPPNGISETKSKPRFIAKSPQSPQSIPSRSMSDQSVAPVPTTPATPDAIGAPLTPNPTPIPFAARAVKSNQSAVLNLSFPILAASSGLS